MAQNRRRILIVAILIGLLLALGLVELDRMPPLWWDEGWTLNVARNWVEQGLFGQLLVGQPAPPGLSAAFPVVAPIALAFKFLGVGVWQARLVGVLFTFGALALLFYLARQLFNRAIAWGTLAAALLMLFPPELHPLIVGRQVLGEMPGLFYLLGGYVVFLLALRRAWFVPLSVILWGIALATKLQIMPFWFVSLSVPLLYALLKRWWQQALWFAVGLIGSWIAYQAVLQIEGLILAKHTLSNTPVAGLYEVTAFVLAPTVRLDALKTAVTSGLPTLLALIYFAWKLLHNLRQPTTNAKVEIMRVSLLSLGGSWFAWYVLLSISWPRYLAPAVFIDSLFVSALLYDLTDRFNLRSTLRRAVSIFKTRHLTRSAAGALLAIVLVYMTVPLSLLGLSSYYLAGADSSAVQTGEFLNADVPATALIETYDSELFFFLNRPYHYPPDQLHVDLNRRSLLGEDVPINYDPLAANPDYLVVGPFGAMWHLYDAVLTSGAFQPLTTIGRYAIYQRVRTN
jgi:hypothetical protein